MKTYILLLGAFLIHTITSGQDSLASLAEDSVRQRIFLIGDGGELVGGKHPVVDWLKKNIDWNDEKNTALFLGDNIYPYGLPTEGEPEYETAKKIIDYQLD